MALLRFSGKLVFISSCVQSFHRDPRLRTSGFGERARHGPLPEARSPKSDAIGERDAIPIQRDLVSRDSSPTSENEAHQGNKA